MDKIAVHRKEIDQIHQELHALLQRRRDSTMAIWTIKQEQGLPFLSTERETQILQDFVKIGQDPSSGGKSDENFDELAKAVMNSILREYETYLKSKFPSKA